MNRLSQFSASCAALMILSGCSTVTEMVESNLPEPHSGRPSIVVSLRAQEAYLYRGGHRTASSRISSGREGYRTPVGRFQVIRKDEDHRSSVYGDYVDDSGRVVKANVDSRRDCPIIFGHRAHESTLTIFCVLRDSHDFEWL